MTIQRLLSVLGVILKILRRFRRHVLEWWYRVVVVLSVGSGVRAGDYQHDAQCVVVFRLEGNEVMQLICRWQPEDLPSSIDDFAVACPSIEYLGNDCLMQIPHECPEFSQKRSAVSCGEEFPVSVRQFCESTHGLIPCGIIG